MIRRGPTASWPFVAALLLFVVGLGILPHARFTMLLERPLWFESAYDEATYALWSFAGGGPDLPSRWLSQWALTGLLAGAGNSWDRAMILADVLFPAAGAVLAWMVVGRLTRRRLFRLAGSLGLLFAQELFSFGCWTLWRFQELVDRTPATPAAVFDWRSLRAASPDWLLTLVPDYGGPFLSIYRTPEPQVSWIVLLAALLLCLDLSRPGLSEATVGRRRVVLLGAVLNGALGLVYFFQASVIVLVEAGLGLALAVHGRRRAARLALAFALVGGLSILAGIASYQSDPGAREWTFRSRLPVLTPSSVAAVAGLAFAASRRLHRQRADNALLPLAFACFATVLVVTNQQVLTGRMISTRDWERYSDYPLVCFGWLLLAVPAIRASAVRAETLYAVAGAALVVGTHGLLTAQQRVFDEFLLANLKSVAMAEAVDLAATPGNGAKTLVLEDPELAPLLQFRLNRRTRVLADGTRTLVRRIDPLTAADGAYGLSSPFTRELFEYLARMGRSPARLRRVLEQETAAGSGFALSFLFDLRDWWAPITDGRAPRPDQIRALLPAIVQAYEDYLEAGDPCWAEPVLLLTRQSPGDRATARWKETLLGEAVVGAEVPLMNSHALLQVSSRDPR